MTTSRQILYNAPLLKIATEESDVSRLATIELHKEELKFSAGHFMVFSATRRERMHGHDYQIQATFHTRIQHNGMAFDCRLYRQKLLALCQTLDYRFILPSQSDYLRLEETADQCIAHFEQESLTFYKKDIVILPICNVTLEELSHWVLQQLLQNRAELDEHQILGMTIKVFNGRGDSGASNWAS